MPQWFPLESNPELMTKYILDLGAASSLEVVEVMSIEEWAFDMVPQPVRAVQFLFPLKEPQLKHEKENPVEALESTCDPTSGAPFFMKQTVGNACGTVALLHALANVERSSGGAARSDTWLSQFLADTATMKPDDAASYVAEGAASEALAAVHTAAATSEDNATEATMDVETHFISFVCAGGVLYELDGRKPGPTPHGACSPEELLPKAVEVIKAFMQRDPTELRFTITALVGPSA